MAMIEEFATNSRGWSKERHQTRRVAAIEADEESSFAKELAELKVRVNQMDTSRREDPVPPNSVIAVTKPNAEATPTEDVNYVQQGGGSNRSFNNNNYRSNQGGGFNVSKGGMVEPAKKEERYEAGIMRIHEVLVQDRRTNDTKIRVVEARLNNLEAVINTISTTVTSIKTQMDQVQQKIDEHKKSAARVADINTKWVVKHKTGAESSSGAQTGVCLTPSGTLQASQPAAIEPAEAPATKDVLVRHNEIVLPFQPMRTFKLEEQFEHFLNMFFKVHINILLVESLLEIPRYTKLLREAVMRKKKPTKADLKLPLHCSGIIQREKAIKQRDPDHFIIRCSIGQGKVDKTLCDLGASINIMPLKYYEKLNIEPLMTADCTIRLADTSVVRVIGRSGSMRGKSGARGERPTNRGALLCLVTT
ncbi:uncharacterized protein LOC125189325 [Salvia hispanica]|uniref:uncharacterized protein LOC125189325 n=1 Tax=Salvia hispanica TaxID=49212 RepID=UPI002009A7B4|nr:uncharacterized protein LOC125189325 [Salvia hispanica]